MIRYGLLAAVVLVAGCAPKPKPFVRRPMGELMALAERDLAPIDVFRAKHGTMTVTFPDEKGKVHRFNLDGMHIVFNAPRGLYLSASYVVQPAALKIGSNDTRYWLAVKPEVNQLWWGRWEHADKPCNTWRMGAPNRLIEALGQVRLRGLAGKYLGPILQRRPPHHVLMYMAPGELPLDDWYIAKEIFLDVDEGRLSVPRIVYYDFDGNIELEIRLGDYRQVVHAGQTHYVPGTIELKMERHGSTMKLKLGKIDVPDKTRPVRFPPPDAYDVVERVDDDCGP